MSGLDHGARQRQVVVGFFDLGAGQHVRLCGPSTDQWRRWARRWPAWSPVIILDHDAGGRQSATAVMVSGRGG